jgi:hypothetical protein
MNHYPDPAVEDKGFWDHGNGPMIYTTYTEVSSATVEIYTGSPSR